LHIIFNFREVSVVALWLDNLMTFSITLTVQHQTIGRYGMVSEGVVVSYLEAESRTHYISNREVEFI
jgi:hypothetical protein